MGRRRPKRPNRLLAALIDEAAISHKSLARRVVDRGRGVGFDLRYDHNSVRRWLDGEQPQPPVPQLIAATLSEELGRVVRTLDCGLQENGGGEALAQEFGLTWMTGVEAATTLWRGDAERRRHLTGLAYSVAVYPAAAIRWLTLAEDDQPSSAGQRHVGRTEVEVVRSMTSTFQDLDNKVGGGRVRSAVVQYLHTEVASLLCGKYTDRMARELFGAAAELTKLAGWMAYDVEEHGLAQRYLVQALRMAKTADDRALAGEILAAMSHQATYVGRPGEAVDLARAGQIAARHAGIGRLESACHIVEAHGHAARHDASACATSLADAERAFDRAEAGAAVPGWLGYFDQAYLSAKIAHCFRDLGDDRLTAQYAEQSLDMVEGYLRGRAFNLCLLASAHARDDPEEAVRIGDEAIGIVEGLSSRRCHSYLRDLRRRLNPHNHRADVAEFRQRVAALTARR